MLNGRMVSSKEVIIKVLRDNGYQVQDFTYSDVIEWLGECMDVIGCAYSLRKTIACIKIQGHRGLLPCDFHSPIQCSAFDCHTGVQIPMRTANNTFHPLVFNNPNTIGLIDTREPIRYDADGNPVFNINEQEVILPKETVNVNSTYFRDVTYELNDNYIFTSFREGADVLFSYYAFPIDKEGFPLIPDNSKFREACAAFVRYKIDYKQWRRGKLSDSIFNHSEREKDWYIGAATTAGAMPSIDTMESLHKQWSKLIPRFNEHSQFFLNLGEQERATFGNSLLTTGFYRR